MNPVFTAQTPNPSTMAFTLQKELEGKAVYLSLSTVQSMVAKMLNFKSFEALKAVESKQGDPGKENESSDSLKDYILSCANPKTEGDCWELKREHNQVYIDVDAAVVKILRTHEGVIVDVYTSHSDADSIGSTYVYHGDCLSTMTENASEQDLLAFANKYGVYIEKSGQKNGFYTWATKDKSSASNEALPSIREAFSDASEVLEVLIQMSVNEAEKNRF